MESLKRREFINKSLRLAAGSFAVYSGLGFLRSHVRINYNEEISASLPMPIQVVIDDVGWWSGYDGSQNNEPYRTGILRNHVPADYLAIVNLGKALNIRPQAAMVMCEWDKFNILKELPASTWMGTNWDNSKWVGPWMEEAAEIIRDNAKHFEITIHAIGHEYWDGAKFTRAEWANEIGIMRPPEEIGRHLDYFGKIMDQHKLGAFPTSFVPSAFKHGFGITNGHNISMAEILRERGVCYINTPFSSMLNAENVPHELFGFDAGVLTINRSRDPLGWRATGVPPVRPLTGPTCGMHWANLIHPDPERNMEIVDEWIKFLASYNDKEDTFLAPDSEYFQSQLLYNLCTEITISGNRLILDFREINSLPKSHIRNEFTLKVRSSDAVRFESQDLTILSATVKKIEENNLFTLNLKRMDQLDICTMVILPEI